MPPSQIVCVLNIFVNLNLVLGQKIKDEMTFLHLQSIRTIRRKVEKFGAGFPENRQQSGNGENSTPSTRYTYLYLLGVQGKTVLKYR